jgi:hypothetical protein
MSETLRSSQRLEERGQDRHLGVGGEGSSVYETTQEDEQYNPFGVCVQLAGGNTTQRRTNPKKQQQHLVSWIGWQCIQTSVIIELNFFVAFSADGALFIIHPP